MKKISSDFYNSKIGIFISNKILFSFGRRISFLVQFILNKYDNALIKNELIQGHVFISNDEVYKQTGYNTKSHPFRNFYQTHAVKKHKTFLSIQNFGVEDGLFYKVDFEKLFNEVIPEFEKNYKNTLSESKYGKETNKIINCDNKKLKILEKEE